MVGNKSGRMHVTNKSLCLGAALGRSGKDLTTPDRGRVTLLDDLPDDILHDILVRLPSRDIGRCRAVKTTWRSATSTPEFMLQHHRSQPSLPIIVGHGQEMLVIGAAGTDSQHKLWPFLPGAEDRHQIRLRGSCDGLLAVSWQSRFYVCNPVTRKHALLPQPQPCHEAHDTMRFWKDLENNIVGFYRHHPTGEHRVLWVSQYVRETYNLHVLTVGSDRPRQVGVPSSPSMEHRLLSLFYFSSHLPVAHRGNLHWHPYVANHVTRGVDRKTITVFDGEAESFRWMSCPAHLSHNIKLFNVKGAFACAGSPHPRSFGDIHVWVMQDYAAEIWAFKYRIDVSQLESSRRRCLTSFKDEKGTPIDLTVKWFCQMAMLNERELLVMINGGHLLRCDVDGKFLGVVNIVSAGRQCPSMWLTEDRLQESIIPISYHGNGMQEDGEEGPFSIEHV